MRFCLKVGSATFLLVCFLCLKESTWEARKNVFYFTLKTLFVLEIIKFMAGKIRFLGAQKSVLLKASSGEWCTPHNFVHLVTLQGTRVCLIVYPVVHQMKYITER